MTDDAPVLERRVLEVDGVQRTYWIPAGTQTGAGRPVLLAFHGLGQTGPMLAEWTGLRARGPAAGFLTAFPDAVDRIWDDAGSGRRDRLDDAAFATALARELTPGERSLPFLAGLSNGAFFVERLVRGGILEASGIALVAGTVRAATRRAWPVPRQPAPVLCLAGTSDHSVPYAGGRGHGALSWIARRRARRMLIDPAGREAVAVEALLADWVAVNGCNPEPRLESLPAVPGDPAVERVTWSGDGRPPVVLYRIERGGHHWPGGPKYLPDWLVGRLAKQLDATGIVLEFAHAASS